MTPSAETGWFVAGTDTEVGKTIVSTGLITALVGQGLRVVGYKPVAAGATLTPFGLRNEDAVALQAVSSVRTAYEDINPICLEPPIAPHLAAAEVGVKIDVSELTRRCDALARDADFVVVEGAGGWLVPLGPDSDMADLAEALGYPVILVVGLRLGCLNHAFLTAAAIAGRGIPLRGWVGNQAGEPMPRLAGNLAALRERIAAPCLGVVPYLPDPSPELVRAHLDLAD
jgi:dethiobiotin synthetase